MTTQELNSATKVKINGWFSYVINGRTIITNKTEKSLDANWIKYKKVWSN